MARSPEISIIIRTKNEERWIAHCLAMIQQQDFKDFEIILVDNASTDHTVRVAQRYPLAQLIEVDRFLPGLALNDGIRASKGKYIVCLSAHCIPKRTDWLDCLRRNFDGDDRVAGVYGRQLPLSFTDAVDKRDLLIVFGQDRRVQLKDYFFHNANSMLPRSVWEEFPFDEQVPNIEDRVWGKAVIDAGYKIVYEPEAAVYHHHGLHQGNKPERAKGVVSVIERIEGDVLDELPDSMRPERANIAAVIPVQYSVERGSVPHTLLSSAVASLHAAKYVDSVYLVAAEESLARELGASWIDRAEIPSADTLGIDELMQQCCGIIEGRGDFPEAMLFVNHDYLHRPEGIFDELIYDAQYKGYDCVFPGYVDYGHYWLRNAEGYFYQTDASLRPRASREPVFRALYGLGCVSSVALVRAGKLVGGKVGILPVTDFENMLRLRDSGAALGVSHPPLVTSASA